MSQRTSKIYNLINSPLFYIFFQKIMSGTSFRKKIIIKNIKNSKVKVLDIGCGPAEVLNYIPNAVYYGYDIDQRSINYAKKKYKDKNHHFFCKKFGKSEIKKLPKIDYVILFGIVHHLNDEEVKNLFELCKKVMKKNAVLLTEDPILIKNQNPIARFFIKNDRGMNIREKSNYLKLANAYFKNIRAKITHQFFVPYTWFSTICKK